MDIGLDTIIYLVLGAVFVLAQLNRKKKSVKQQEAESEPNVSPPDTAFDEVGSAWKKFWEDEADPEEPEREFRPEVVSPPTFSHTLSSQLVFNDQKLNQKSEYVDEDDITSKSLESIFANSDTELQVEAENFDLRSAVVYSAILERKYV